MLRDFYFDEASGVLSLFDPVGKHAAGLIKTTEFSELLSGRPSCSLFDARAFVPEMFLCLTVFSSAQFRVKVLTIQMCSSSKEASVNILITKFYYV